MKSIALPLLYAFIAAAGNSMYVAAQKRAGAIGNPFAIVVLSSAICLALTSFTAPMLGRVGYAELLRDRWLWALVGGFGLYFVYVGFNLLFVGYGASYYVLYAVLSIVTTTIFVGAWMFREQMNVYHWLAVATALATVALYSLGQSRATN